MDSEIKKRLISHFNYEINQNGEDKIFFIRGNKSYSNKDMLEEITKESKVSEELVADLLAGTCYRLERINNKGKKKERKRGNLLLPY